MILQKYSVSLGTPVLTSTFSTEKITIYCYPLFISYLAIHEGTSSLILLQFSLKTSLTGNLQSPLKMNTHMLNCIPLAQRRVPEPLFSACGEKSCHVLIKEKGLENNRSVLTSLWLDLKVKSQYLRAGPSQSQTYTRVWYHLLCFAAVPVLNKNLKPLKFFCTCN